MLCTPNSRAQLYAQIARLLLHEVDLQCACSLRELPGMAEHVPPGVELEDWLVDMRAEHQRLFSLNIPPYESLFRGRELMVNTVATQRVAAFYQTCGFAPPTRRVAAPDHLAIELTLAATLSARVSHSAAAGAQFASLLREHLAVWLPACAEALARGARAPLYRVLAEVATELVLYDLAEFTPARPRALHESEEPDRTRAWAWGGRSESAGLRQIVRRLLTPDEVGILISRADIAALGHALGLPAPVAERERMLLRLLGVAGQFGMLPALLDALAGLLRAADKFYVNLTTAHPAWDSYGRVWRGRVVAGLALLDGLAQQYQALRHRPKSPGTAAIQAYT
jgi:putative dimethyl sulfoxide reductase chaperone